MAHMALDVVHRRNQGAALTFQRDAFDFLSADKIQQVAAGQGEKDHTVEQEFFYSEYQFPKHMIFATQSQMPLKRKAFVLQAIGWMSLAIIIDAAFARHDI
jgi:phage terminase Nu1 subunit (DNA packaging protein)